ncbi:MAG: alkaline phosphatase family protein [Pseudomonadales bacterium]|nr:alkaline phosphatase family protein [Pseudomonadales bacterium]
MKNVLFITADQWRGECLSSLGHRVRTPNLDWLASRGVTFTRHFANAVPCGPSRASIHTGMYLQNHRSGTNGTPLDQRFTNWALMLRARGYDPVLFGYTDTSNDPRAFEPDDPVLRSYEGPLPGINPIVLMGENPQPWADWLASKGYDIPDPAWKLYMGKSGLEYEQGGSVPAPLTIPAEHHDTWFMVDQVISYLTRRQSAPPQEEPGFCIHLSLLRPHPPWVAPAPYNEMYPPQELTDFNRADTADTEAATHPFIEYFMSLPHFTAPSDLRRMTRLKSAYYGLMTEVDHNLGRLFEWLKANDELDNTLIIFTSDHGEQMGDHWLLGKLGYFDASYHIPLIICDPSASANGSRGMQLQGFTENVDIMPTMLDYLDTEIPIQCDGRSLREVIESGSFPANWRQEAHWEFDFRNIPDGEQREQALGLTHPQCTLNVVRGSRYKYVHFTGLPPLFFDLEADPGEHRNLATDPAYSSLVLEYAQKLLSWRMNHDEPGLTHLALTENGVVARPAPRYPSP